MPGLPGASCHLEFTQKTGHSAGRAPEDNLLVLYLRDSEEWQKAVEKLEMAGHRPVKAFNPYWDVKGKTFEDSDGYPIVLQDDHWDSSPETHWPAWSRTG